MKTDYPDLVGERICIFVTSIERTPLFKGKGHFLGPKMGF